MDFALSKLLGWFTKPSDFLAILAVLAVLVPCPRTTAGRVLRLLPALTLLVVGVVPVGELALQPLEERFSRPAHLPDDVDGIIVLGGSTIGGIPEARGEVGTNDAAERLHQGLFLALQYPEAELVHSGGSGEFGWQPGQPTEAHAARRWWMEAGLPAERMSFEDQSRNTRENAQFSRELLAPKPGEVWLLVTSAAHMPRSVGSFHAVGFDVLPWPCDYRSDRSLRPNAWTFVSDNLQLLDIAAHEWIGLLYYRWRGWTDMLLPEPKGV